MKRLLTLIVALIMILLPSLGQDKFTVVIDPGHGGKDSGAARGEVKEKDVNLAVALNLGRLIEENHPDVKVVYTRKTDSFVELMKRAEIANKAKANLFISIHTNSTAAKTTLASGADTYILGLARSDENLDVAKRENSVILLEDNYKQKYEGFDPKSPESYIIFEFMTNKYMEQSLEFASSVQEDFKSVAKRTDRGVKQAGFLVLRETAMPSVLIELGFINNPKEAKYLSSAIGQRTLASAIYSGFKKYKKKFDSKQGSTTIASSSKSNTNLAAAKPEPKKTEPKVEVKPEPTKVEPKPEPKKTEPKKEDTAAQTKPQQTGSNTQYVSKPRYDVGASPVAKTETAQTQPKESTPAPKSTQPDKPATVQTPSKSTPVVASSTGSEFRVQFLLSKTILPANSSQFKGLTSVSYYEDGGYYKYTYGSVSTRAEAISLQKEARAKFADAFIIELRNGKRVK